MKKSKLLSLIIAVLLVLPALGVGVYAKSNTAKVKTTKNAKATSSSKVTKYPLKVTDSFDRTVTITKEPKRVISLAPNITETVFALKKGAKLVGRTDYCDYPSSVSKIPSVGTLQTPSIEKITALKPDLVIASTHFQKDVLKKLEDLKIKVVVLYGEENFSGAYKVIASVGRILNAQGDAEKIITGMDKKVNSIRAKVKNLKKPTVYYVVGFGQYGDYTAGSDTFINSAIEMAGGKNSASDVKGWKYSLEKLMQNNPDIMICSKYYDSKKGLQETNGYKDLNAVKTGKLYEIDNSLLDRQGPRLADGLYELAKIIHPEVFK